MGNRCFRPVNEHNQPVYVSSISKAFDEANRVYNEKRLPKDAIMQQITSNQHRKGNLKKLFDHLHSHQKNILPAIKQCNKRTTSEKSFPAIIIGNVFCKLLVKMLSGKKTKNTTIKTGNITEIAIKSRSNIISNQQAFKNLIHELESHFFQLVTKILVYNKEKTIQNSLSETLILYSEACGEKITAKKELKDILDLYLTVVFQKNINLIDNNSFLPFYAYSTLISKSKTELFTADFIEKHFGFILKLFFELENTKKSNKSLVQSEDFQMFEEGIESIIKQFIIFSSENRKIKDHILNEIMLQEDAQKFDHHKTMKLQRVIYESLNSYIRQHFMFDWLGFLIKYIGRKMDGENQSIKDSFIDSIQEIHVRNVSANSMKNIASVESKSNAIETLERWFSEELLNTQKTLEYFSIRIFEALLLNLYNPQGNHESVSSKSKEVLNYFLSRKPRKLAEILIILNKQLRKNKNQYFASEHHNLRANLTGNTGNKVPLKIIEEEAIEGLWKNDINFLLRGLTIKDSSIKLSFEEIEQIYAPIVKVNKPSINLLYLIELGAISLKYSDLENQKVQIEVYNFLISLTGSLKVYDAQIEFDYAEKFTQESRFLLHELLERNEVITYSFFKYSFKNLLKENSRDQVWTLILIEVILINYVLQEKKHKNSDRFKKLNKFLEEILSIIKIKKSNPQAIYTAYIQNKNMFDLSDRVSAHLQKLNLKPLQQLQINNEINPRSSTNMECSVLSSKMEVSQSNPDTDFKNIYRMMKIK